MIGYPVTEDRAFVLLQLHFDSNNHFPEKVVDKEQCTLRGYDVTHGDYRRRDIHQQGW